MAHDPHDSVSLEDPVAPVLLSVGLVRLRCVDDTKIEWARGSKSAGAFVCAMAL